MDTKSEHLKEELFSLNLWFYFLMTSFNFGFVKVFLSGFFSQVLTVVTYWLYFGAMKHFNGSTRSATTSILFGCN